MESWLLSLTGRETVFWRCFSENKRFLLFDELNKLLAKVKVNDFRLFPSISGREEIVAFFVNSSPRKLWRPEGGESSLIH